MYVFHLEGITMKINLHRDLYHHLFSTYVPSTLIVIIAWLGLFISPSHTEGKKTGKVSPSK